MAEERGTMVGDEVGYLIRFDASFDPDATRVKVSYTRLELSGRSMDG